MKSRGLRILLIGVFSLWFGVIVPGHERGAIRVAGSDAHCNDASAVCHVAPVVQKPSCSHCPTTGKPLTQETAPAKPKPVDPSSHCAICKFIGVLDAPVMVTFDLPPSYLLSTLDPLPVEAIAAQSLLLSHRGRGPPHLFM